MSSCTGCSRKRQSDLCFFKQRRGWDNICLS
nr:MAG TPA: hypothetical protein [Caudoviricetes sp.]